MGSYIASSTDDRVMVGSVIFWQAVTSSTVHITDLTSWRLTRTSSVKNLYISNISLCNKIRHTKQTIFPWLTYLLSQWVCYLHTIDKFDTPIWFVILLFICVRNNHNTIHSSTVTILKVTKILLFILNTFPYIKYMLNHACCVICRLGKIVMSHLPNILWLLIICDNKYCNGYGVKVNFPWPIFQGIYWFINGQILVNILW